MANVCKQNSGIMAESLFRGGFYSRAIVLASLSRHQPARPLTVGGYCTRSLGTGELQSPPPARHLPGGGFDTHLPVRPSSIPFPAFLLPYLFQKTVQSNFSNINLKFPYSGLAYLQYGSIMTHKASKMHVFSNL